MDIYYFSTFFARMFENILIFASKKCTTRLCINPIYIIIDEKTIRYSSIGSILSKYGYGGLPCIDRGTAATCRAGRVHGHTLRILSPRSQDCRIYFGTTSRPGGSHQRTLWQFCRVEIRRPAGFQHHGRKRDRQLLWPVEFPYRYGESPKIRR